MTFGFRFFGWVYFHEFYIIFTCKEQFGHFLPEELLTHISILERLLNILELLSDSITLFQRHLFYYSFRDQTSVLSLMPSCLTTGMMFGQLQI